LIGIPLGILITRWPVLEETGAGRRQHYPDHSESGALRISIAGNPGSEPRADRLTILALTLYALLPLIRNTYTGIKGRRSIRRGSWPAVWA